MIKELLELQKQQVIYQSNHTEILKLLVDAMKRPVEVHLPASDELFQPLDTEPILVELQKISDLLEANLNRPPQVQIEPSLVNLPTLTNLPGSKPRSRAQIQTDFCVEHFKKHPEDKKLPGRVLSEKYPMPDGYKISYVTWNKAKKPVE